ncbi:hypothetical protein U6G28_07695 [Actinomycetaceae bacterium MB13-C1-2]|nr:hypothetical protein U6G28_07695 [Actinomycetaceae bacterium MB13-C1-2]
MQPKSFTARAKAIATLVAALVVIGVIIWIDVNTGVWNELVVLSGLAAGLVTFLLTTMVLDRILARSAARRWAPVNRIALSEFLHAIADEERSEISRNKIVIRSFKPIPDHIDERARTEALEALQHQVVAERQRLADVLSRWAQFLASSGNNEEILTHIASIAWQFDRIRDEAIESETDSGLTQLGELNAEIQSCNDAVTALEAEIRTRLSAENLSGQPN